MPKFDAAHAKTDRLLAAAQRDITRIYRKRAKAARDEINALIRAAVATDDTLTAKKRREHFDKNGGRGLIALIIALLMGAITDSERVITEQEEEIYSVNFVWAIAAMIFLLSPGERTVRLGDTPIPAYPRRKFDRDITERDVTARVEKRIYRAIKHEATPDEVEDVVKREINHSASLSRTAARTNATRLENLGRLDAFTKTANQLKDTKTQVLKKWNTQGDGRVRDLHEEMDGEFRIYNQRFSNGGMYPGDPMLPPEQRMGCRCFITGHIEGLENLSAEERENIIAGLKTLNIQYESAKKAIAFRALSGIIEGAENNYGVREWYSQHVHSIPSERDSSVPLEQQAYELFDQRNQIKIEARDAMANQAERARLDEKWPIPSFEDMINHKVEDKGMTREEALEDIIKTASKTNAKVDERFRR